MKVVIKAKSLSIPRWEHGRKRETIRPTPTSDSGYFLSLWIRNQGICQIFLHASVSILSTLHRIPAIQISKKGMITDYQKSF